MGLQNYFTLIKTVSVEYFQNITENMLLKYSLK